MATAAKILGVAPANIAKICGVAKASIKKVMGVEIGGGGGTPALIDSYSETNASDSVTMSPGPGSAAEVAQVLSLASGKTITSAKFYLHKIGSPTGNMYAKLYATTGTIGTDGKPTGSALATTSDAIAAASLSGSAALVEFTFSTPYAASAGGLAIAVEFSGGSAGNTVQVNTDISSPSHAGNYAYTDGTWYGYDWADVCFYLYGY